MVAIYDYEDMTAYVAYSEYNTTINAYERPFFKLNMTELWNYEIWEEVDCKTYMKW